MRLVLPGMRQRRAAAGVQVVDEQGRHEGPGGGGLKDFEAEPGRARVRRGQHAVLGNRPGPCRRSDVDRYDHAAVPGDGGAPALKPLGQSVVGALLLDEGVADARVSAGRVAGAEQPSAGHRAQRPPAEFRRRRPGAVGTDGVGDRVGRDGEDVGRCREEAEGDIPALGQQAHGQRVDGAGHADVGGAVGVDVIAEHQRAVQVGQPVGDRGNVGGQIEARALR